MSARRTASPAPVEAPLLTPDEVASYLRQSRRFVQDHRVALGGRKLGRSLRFRLADVDAFVERGRLAAEPQPAPVDLSEKRVQRDIDMAGLPAVNAVTGKPWGFSR